MNCDICNKNVPVGTAYVTLLKNIEQIERDEKYNEEFVQVIHSEDFLNLCPSCGNKLNAEALGNWIKTLAC